MHIQIINYFNQQWEQFENDDNALFIEAPVKQYDRCLIKTNTDYNSEEYPSVACIVDCLRCSITYNNTANLLSGLNTFINNVKNDKIDNITKILRIKNGFNNILKWQSFNDAQYCDLKLNVIFNNQETNESQICEIQFLIKFLLKAKK